MSMKTVFTCDSCKTATGASRGCTPPLPPYGWGAMRVDRYETSSGAFDATRRSGVLCGDCLNKVISDFKHLPRE